MVTNGALFLIVLGIGAVIWMTQAGAKESKILSSPVACIIFAFVVGMVLYFIWHGSTGVIFTH